MNDDDETFVRIGYLYMFSGNFYSYILPNFYGALCLIWGWKSVTDTILRFFFFLLIIEFFKKQKLLMWKKFDLFTFSFMVHGFYV